MGSIFTELSNSCRQARSNGAFGRQWSGGVWAPASGGICVGAVCVGVALGSQGVVVLHVGEICLVDSSFLTWEDFSFSVNSEIG